MMMMMMMMLKSLFKSKHLLLVPLLVLHIDFGSLLLSATLNVVISCVCVVQTFGHVYLILVHRNYHGSFCSLSIYIFILINFISEAVILDLLLVSKHSTFQYHERHVGKLAE
jgi:hypothetical protein